MHWITTYTHSIATIAAGGDATEFSYRTDIENMLKAAAAEFGVVADILQEPSRIKNSGAPDFRISAKGGGVIGYVECKNPGENLSKLLGKAQLEKYRALSDNILLTDSWRWYWLRDGKKIEDAILTEKPNTKTKADFTNLLRAFMEVEAEKIGDAKRLASALARRCALLREGLEAHGNDDPSKSSLHGLLNAFQTALDTELSFDKFADAFAQTLVYSLLLAKLKAPAASELDLYNINRYIPANFAVIREITVFLQGLHDSEYEHIRWVVDDILAAVNNMDAAAVSETMSYRNGGKGFDDSDDPYLYFYENFLAAYDAKLRERRGVYYTPPPVVKFIVRAVDDLLRRDFGLSGGIAETNAVTALDFAAGTGTFMLEMIRKVLSDTPPARRDMLTRGHILKNFYGFELLMAPYAIAHLKLSQFLADNGVPLKHDERINVFLTNTLERIGKQVELPMMPKLAEEVNRAQKIKDAPVLVITGNPPYSGHSQNTGKWIVKLIQDYTKDFPELQRPGQGKWLQDDYVKFIRFAQWKMESVERGIIAIITNHSFLDNPTFRGMRKSLLDSFDTLYFLDLHGNAKKKETAPGGGKDENVFDIQQGVAISILVKNPNAKQKGVFHADFYGKRDEKYKDCLENDIATTPWKQVTPTAPFYLFIPRDEKLVKKYESLWSITNIFDPPGKPAPGLATQHDQFAISFTKDEALNKVKKLLATKTEEEARVLFRLCAQKQWSYEVAKKQLADGRYKEKVTQISYRPFDIRWTIYDSNVAVHRRVRVMHHMLAGENLAITSIRQASAIGGDEFNAVFVAELIVDLNLNRRGGALCFPAYRYEDTMGQTTRNENLNPEFRKWIDDRYAIAHSPEDILSCIYAILHSPDYRKRYADFLRSDFPRIPFPDKNDEFKRLADIGGELIKAHLLRDHCAGDLAQHAGTGTSHKVEKIRHDEKGEKLYFNQDEYFAPVPPQVFNFQIGGYQPLDKYLKSRKDRTLTLPETETIQKTANAIAFTIEKMREIDQ